MDGRVVQCVPLDRAAYHVGGNTAWQGRDGVDFFSIGVRLETDGPGRWGWTDEQWIAGVKLCRWLVRRYGIEKPDVVTVKMVLNGGGREVDVFPLAGLLRELYPAEQQALLEGGLEGE
jgi:N-acetyl-anhydromuramyl-L-alanine amidase AmpD